LQPEAAIGVIKTITSKFPVIEDENDQAGWEQRKRLESLLQLAGIGGYQSVSEEPNHKGIEVGNKVAPNKTQVPRKGGAGLTPKEKLLNMIAAGDGPTLHLKLRLHELEEEEVPIYIREQVWKRGNGKCAMCGAQGFDVHYDHIVPLERGGVSTTENLQLLCQSCILKKLKKP